MATVHEVEVETAEAPTTVIKVWIPKANAYLDVDISEEKTPKECYMEALVKGFQAILTRGMSGPNGVSTKGLEGEELEEAQARAYEIAQQNLESMYAGEIRLTSVKRVKEKKGKVKTKAMQNARVIIKAQIKAEGGKVSHYTAKQISELAEELLVDQPELIEEAREQLAKDDKEAEKVKARLEKSKIKLTSKVKADPKRVKAAEERAARAKVAAKARKEARANA